MLGTRTTWSRATVLPAVVTAGIVCWMIGDLTVSKTHAQQAQSTFMGGTPSRLDLNGLSTSRLKFPAGSRSNWHSHATGQLLMAEEGRGRTQERGKPIREVVPGQPWWTPAASNTGTGSARPGPRAVDDLRGRSEVARAGHRRGVSCAAAGK